MKNIYLLFLIVVLSIIALVSSLNHEAAFNDDKNLTVNIKDADTSTINSIDLEEYIIGVVAGEMPASFNEEALKAQAVAARTYAVYKMSTTNKEYDLVSDITNQVYITEEQMQEKWQEDYSFYYEKVKNAVVATKDLVMTYDGEVICAYYFAMSNGKTEDVSLVFGETRDYLVSVDSSWDESVKNFSYTITLAKSDFCTKLSIDCSNIIISEVQRSPSGRVNNITINNQKFQGTELRKLLDLRSTDFEITVLNDIVITTRGYGHGVGMSQYGANEMAKFGKNYEEILKYYYQDVAITKINV